MCNEAAVVVAKDADALLLLVYVLGQLECFLLPWHIKNDSNPFITLGWFTTIFSNTIAQLVMSD